MNYGRLRHLAELLRREMPRYHQHREHKHVRVQATLTPEDAVVLRALAVEARVSHQRAASELLRAALSVDRVLVRWVFFGEAPKDRETRARVIEAAKKEIEGEVLPSVPDW